VKSWLAPQAASENIRRTKPFSSRPAGGLGALLDAVELVGRAHPFVAEHRSHAVGGLEQQSGTAGPSLSVTATVGAQAIGLTPCAFPPGFSRTFSGGKYFSTVRMDCSVKSMMAW